MSNPLAEQLDAIISSVVTDLEDRNVLLISPNSVANEVNKIIDPDNVSPELKTYASTMQIRQSTRQYLRRRHDPIGRVEKELEEGITDMFADQLQTYYPVKRADGNGYALTKTLTHEDVMFNVNQMRSKSISLAQHADALEAWFASRPTG